MALNNTVAVKTKTSTKMDYDATLATINDPSNITLLEHCHELTKDISANDSGSLRVYGREVGQLMSKTSETILQRTHSNAIGDASAQAIVDLNTKLIETLNGINIKELKSKTPFQKFLMKIPIIGDKLVLSAQNLEAKYNPIADNIETITTTMSNNGLKALEENHQIGQDIVEIENSLIKNHELVLALKVKENEEKQILEDMHANADKYEVSEIKRQEEFVNRIGRRVDSMIQTEANLQLSLIELEGTRAANYVLAERADDIVTNVVPNFKLSISVALHQGEQRKIAASQNAVIDTANKLVKETAAAFHQNAVEVERLNSRGIYDYDTLVSAVNELKNAASEIRSIRAKNIAEREQNRAKMVQLFRVLENELVD
jgi:uncharacterized protein YaaN involved in tellurite resistance